MHNANKLGVLLPRDIAIEDFLTFAHTSERLGFDELWLAEDCFFRGGIAQATAVLASTSRITVGIGILPAALRNPVATALEVSFLTELYGDRLILGIGHGMPTWMKQAGVWPESPLTLLSENITAVRQLLSGKTIESAGRYVHLDDIALEFPPRSVPPIMAGVRGPKSLGESGRVADGTILAEPSTPAYVVAARQSIRGGAEHRIVAYNVAAVNESADSAREVVRPALRVVAEPEWRAHIQPLDFSEELYDLRSRCDTADEFAERMPAEWVDRLALAGTPETVAQRIRELHEAGVDTAVLVPPSGHDYLDSLRNFETMLTLFE
ncbi:LLM class flavin-dependent oxidoreductase [Rhodococcus sp. Eu-32]|uniref:LLM class flavin-dependent oxidoreductase n=1 Tax=Rhodococcus sp. Eu-32 TaxID=1017319 RepID=UPI000DF3AA5F|nr:LLM class flavin-dependent oxidoreductase [Rhodococcus sp. Eu-32]RRQ27157.1 LLM class flavin-dependent oxidoreductase [Rhodococcus sp. Eu-32]